MNAPLSVLHSSFCVPRFVPRHHPVRLGEPALGRFVVPRVVKVQPRAPVFPLACKAVARQRAAAAGITRRALETHPFLELSPHLCFRFLRHFLMTWVELIKSF